jgi:hypothetical protein
MPRLSTRERIPFVTTRAWLRRWDVLGAIVAAAAIGAGSFQPFYLRIFAADTATLAATYTEVPYYRIPGFRQLLLHANEVVPVGASALVVTPHRPWDNGYGYAYRRAQYVLTGRDVLPLIDEQRGSVLPQSLADADYVVCWRACEIPLPRTEVVWRGSEGVVLRRVR